MRALLIEFNPHSPTGERAGNVSPKDPNFVCPGWQDLESTPAREIRIVMDGNTAPFEGIPGITVLRSNSEINAEIDKLPAQFKIGEPTLFALDIEQQKIKLKNMDGSTAEILSKLKAQGIKGITQPIRKHVEEVFPER